MVAGHRAPRASRALRRGEPEDRLLDVFGHRVRQPRCWFNIQDVPEANLYAGQVDGGDDYNLGTPKYPIFSMFQRWSRT